MNFNKILKMVGLLIIFTVGLIFVQQKQVNAATDYYEITMDDGSFTSSRKLGDVNLDGIYTIRDKKLLMNYVNSQADLPGYFNGDFNGDGTVDINDFNISNSTSGDGVEYNPACEISNTFLIGTKFTLKLTKPGNYGNENFNINDVSWNSSDSNIATVNSTTGEVEIKNFGDGTIEAEVNGQVVTSFDFTAVDANTGRQFNNVINYGSWPSGGGNHVEKKFYCSAYASTDSVKFSVNGENLKAIYMDMHIDIDTQPIVSDLSTGWEVTSSNYENGRFRFIVEVKSEDLNNTQNGSRKVEFNVITKSENETKFGYTVVSVNSVDVTDSDSDGVHNIAKNKSLLSNFVPVTPNTDIISVKSGCGKKIKSVGSTLYVKLNGTNNGEKSYATLADLFDCLNIADGYEFITDGAFESYAIFDSTNRDNSIHDITRIGWKSTSDDSYGWEYKIVVVGDLVKTSASGINIGDVTTLRQLIVGTKPSLGIVCREASVTDNYATVRKLGNIGDVIAIRLRILNNKWNDITD